MFSRATRRGEGGRHRRRLYPVLVFPLLAMTVIAGFLVFHSAHFTQAAPVSGMVSLPGTISPLVKSSSLTGPTDPNQQINLSIGLRPRNMAAMTSFAQDISRPKSINYHRFLSQAQIDGVFSPTKAAYTAVIQFLQNAGFTVTHTYNHRLLVAFKGTGAQVEQTFHVTLNNYTAPDGHTFYANATEPSLPITVAQFVQSINGLNNAARMHHPPVSAKSSASPSMTINPQGVACPAANAGALSSLAPAYNMGGLYNSTYGQGQTVALYELDGFQGSDISAFESCYSHSPAGTAHVPVQTIITGQGKIPSDSGIAEVELDAELVTAVAPQLGLLKIYEAANDTSDRLAEWAQIVQDAPAVVSTSWGGCEKLSDPNEISLENIFFTLAAAQGQTILAASGDSGSAGCLGQSSSVTNLSVDDPAGQPFVTAIGGTTMHFNGTRSESTWNDQYGASGGGISQYWAAPAWQNGPGVNNSYSSGVPCHASSGFCREVPDISLNADPATGYEIYCTAPQASFCKASSPWLIVGGTSAAAPIMAAITALQNEYLLTHGGFNVGFLNPLLYQLASGPQAVFDIQSGNNDFLNKNSGAYPATAGYDMATGLGSPDASGLAQHYLALSQQRSSPVNSTWYFAEGNIGGGFQEYITLQNPSATNATTVNITYLFESRPSITVSHTVNAGTRYTVSVNGDLNTPLSAPHLAVAAIVQTPNGAPGIVAERPMYFNYHGIMSGTDVVGTTSPATSYYFPEADTRQSGRNYATYITMLNPSTTQTTNVTVTYYTGHCGLTGQGACPTQQVAILPLHRGTATPLAFPLYQQMSVKVTATLPVVVERPMYFSDNIATAGGATTGAASEIGAKAPGTDWLFAEGYTGTNFQEYLVLANFGTAATNANIQLKYDNGHTQTLSVSVPALGQTYFDVNQANAHPTGTCDVNPCQPKPAVSSEVTSAAPIVADRLMYFHFGGNHYSGGTDAVGEPGPASHNVYAFAEGYTGGTFSEYLTLQNPTNTAEVVAVTLFADTYVLQEQVSVSPHSRRTVGINGIITPIAQAYYNLGSNSFSVSMTIQTMGGGTIVAERPMYFNYGNADQGGTDAFGYVGG